MCRLEVLQTPKQRKRVQSRQERLLLVCFADVFRFCFSTTILNDLYRILLDPIAEASYALGVLLLFRMSIHSE